MNIYHVQYYFEESPDEIITDELKAKSLEDLKGIIESNRAIIVGTPEFIKEDTSRFSGLVDTLGAMVKSASKPKKTEILRFLRAYSAASKQGLSKIQSLRKAKSRFGLTAKKVRALCDELIAEMEKGDVEDFADLLLRFDTYFPDRLVQILVAARGSNVDPAKLISNDVPPEKVGTEMEGYVQMEERRIKFKKELRSTLTGPTVWLIGVVSGAIAITTILVPLAIQAISQVKTFAPEDFPLPSRQLYELSQFLTNHGALILVGFLIIVGITIFIYATNRELRYQIESKILRMWVLQDILRVYYTLEIASTWQIFLSAGKTHRQCLEIMADIVPLLPMKDELRYMADTYQSSFADVLVSYPDEEKYFTESLYINVNAYLNDGLREACFSEIIKDNQETWDNDVKFYPQKLGYVIKGFGLTFGSYLVFGLGGFVVSLNTKGGIN